MTREVPAAFLANIEFGGTGVRSIASRRPFQFFLLTYGLTVLGLASVAYFWDKAGFDLLVVALGWPHVLLGLAFNLNRIKSADLKSQLLFGWLILLTIAIAIGHSRVPITTLIYLYFVFHAFRDEIYIFHERRNDYRFRGRVFDGGGRTVFAVAIALALVSQAVPRNSLLQSKMYDVQCIVAAILTGMALVKRPRRLFSRWPGLRYAFPAFFLIVASMTGMEFLRWHRWPAPLFFTFLVIFHYFSWYVFSMEKIDARTSALRRFDEPRRSLFSWISTRRGFLTVVIAMNVLSFAGAWSYQIRHVSTKLGYGFDLKYFLYFLVLHVTTSFLPRQSANREKTQMHPEETFAAAEPIPAESSSS